MSSPINPKQQSFSDSPSASVLLENMPVLDLPPSHEDVGSFGEYVGMFWMDEMPNQSSLIEKQLVDLTGVEEGEEGKEISCEIYSEEEQMIGIHSPIFNLLKKVEGVRKKGSFSMPPLELRQALKEDTLKL